MTRGSEKESYVVICRAPHPTRHLVTCVLSKGHLGRHQRYADGGGETWPTEADLRAAESNMMKPRCQAVHQSGLRCEFRQDHAGKHLNGIDVLGYQMQWDDAKEPDIYDRIGKAIASAMRRGHEICDQSSVEAALRVLDKAMLCSADFTISPDSDWSGPMVNARYQRKAQEVTIILRGVR